MRPGLVPDPQRNGGRFSEKREGAGGSNTRSPKEEGRMVSPGSCLSLHSMLPSTSHMQAPSSTTTEGSMESKYIPPPLDIMVLPDRPVQIKTEPRAGGSGAPKLCQVCDDNASGFHYGVWSCEGCKAFFKRSIQGPVDYVCPATNNCTIDKHRRKSCQACRLRKCYEVGMNKGSQRKTERKNSNPGTSGGKKRCRADSSDSAVNSTSSGPQAAFTKIQNIKRGRNSHSVLDALLRADMQTVESHHDHSAPATRVNLLNTLIKVADQELVVLINWAKQVPGYSELSLGDQVHLIECCWMDLLLMTTSFRSIVSKGKQLIFAPDFALERHHWCTMGMERLLRRVAGFSEQMVEYGVTREEMVLMQAMILVNAGLQSHTMGRLASYEKLNEMRVMILDAFGEASQRHHGDDGPAHPYTLLLLMSQVRVFSEQCIVFLQELKRENCGVTFGDLLTEMLDVHQNDQNIRVVEQEQTSRPSMQQP